MITLRARLMLSALPPLVAATSIQPAVASADCSRPPLALLWSYPANGDVNVPTNAVSWALSSNWSAPRVTLDGAPLSNPSEGGMGIPLGTLAPQHDYVLRLDYESSRPGDGPTVFEIRFRTGDGPASKPQGVPVTGVQRADSVGASTCPDVVHAQDCFDTGQDTLLTFDVADDRAIAWQVQGEVWPARCGKPSLFSSDRFSRRCFDVSAIGVGGLRSAPTQYCVAPPDAGANDAQAPTVDEPEAPPPARGDSDAGASSSDGPSVSSSPGTSRNEVADASCTISSGRAGSGTQRWFLLALLAGAMARVSRVRVRRSSRRAEPCQPGDLP